MHKQSYSVTEALEKIKRYCAYQERSHQETRDKLYNWGLYSNEVENILSELIAQNFLNEERFARAYTSGKFRIKKWGRRAIINGLKEKKVSSACISLGMKEIEEEEYRETLQSVLNKKLNQLKTKDFKTIQSAGRYAIGKGYEPELVWEILKQMKI